MKGLEVFRVEGKVTLITGGGSGIGKSCALLLSSEAGRFITGQDFVIDGGAMCK